MLMSYIGALKAWIYGPILRNLGSNLWTLRIPVLLAGTASVWLFFVLLRRISGHRAALIGCALLACDALYLLTTTFDWGPVAFQHLLLIGGAAVMVRFFEEGSNLHLVIAAFLFGLALFDKALAIWTLSALAVAGLATFPREIMRTITVRRVLIAVLAFFLGAVPLFFYNWNNNWGTFRGNFARNTADLPMKMVVLERTFDGSGLFGWMMFEDVRTANPHPPSTAAQKLTDRISTLAGHPRRSLFPYAFGLALLVAPFAGRRELRIILFAVIAMALAWIQMAINKDTGGTIHHTILLWPLPQLIVAVSFAGISRRVGVAAVTAITTIVAISGALVINEYYVKTVRNGGAEFWTDGVLTLTQYLKDAKPKTWVFALDWSIADQVRLLTRGRVKVAIGSDQVSKPEMTEEDRRIATQMVGMSDALYVAHTPEFEIFKGNSEKLLQFAGGLGYRRELLATIPDRYGRNVYEVYKLVK
jgi:hypothetical protein